MVSAKKAANSSDARSASRSGSSGSVMMVSSYSRLFSNVAGILVLRRSLQSQLTRKSNAVMPL